MVNYLIGRMAISKLYVRMVGKFMGRNGLQRIAVLFVFGCPFGRSFLIQALSDIADFAPVIRCQMSRIIKTENVNVYVKSIC